MPVKIPDGDFEGRLKQIRSQGSLLPVPLPLPTERERERDGQEREPRLSLKLSLFLATLIKDDDDSSENVSKKMNLRSFKLNRVYLDLLNTPNAGDFSWS